MNIDIIPGIFLKKTEDNKYIIRCLIGEDLTEDRIFDSYSLKEIDNPKYIFIGIMVDVGMIQITFTDANKFKNLFKKKWNVLNK